MRNPLGILSICNHNLNNPHKMKVLLKFMLNYYESIIYNGGGRHNNQLTDSLIVK